VLLSKIGERMVGLKPSNPRKMDTLKPRAGPPPKPPPLPKKKRPLVQFSRRKSAKSEGGEIGREGHQGRDKSGHGEKNPLRVNKNSLYGKGQQRKRGDGKVNEE